MSLKFRRFLYIFFIAAFLTITPLVSFYAAGYKISSGFSLKKTGALIIDTEPRGAKIFLNGEPRQDFLKKFYAEGNSFVFTPAKIKNLLPGKYEIKLELDGYSAWQKTLEVKPGQATFAEDISLFKDNLPAMLQAGIFSHAAYAPDGSRYIVQNADAITLADMEGDKTEVYELTERSKRALASSTPVWSPGGQRVIIGQAIFDLDDWLKPVFLDESLGGSAYNLKWLADETGVYYQKEGKLFLHMFASGKSEPIAPEMALSDYQLRNENLFLIGQNGLSSELIVLNGSYKISRRINLPNSAYTFFTGKSPLLSLYDTVHHILYLIDPFSGTLPLRDSISNLTLAEWIDDNRLLYTNGYEIWQYELEKNGKNLLTRISQEVTGLFWHPSGNYIVFTTGRSVFVIELDDREKRNITEIVGLEAIKWPYLNARGDNMYFYARIGSQAGIYKLAIQ